MSTDIVTLKIQPTQIQPSSLQNTKKQQIIIKQLPDSVLNRISSFGSDLNFHIARGVNKRWQRLFPNILTLKNSNITDEALINIIDKSKDPITWINLEGCENLTDKSIQHLSKLEDLRKLRLNGCRKITVNEVSNLRNLKELDLSGNYLPNDAFINLSNLQNLKKLDLAANSVSDSGLKELSKLKHLKKLNIAWGDGISDEGVKNLSILPKLTELNLSGSNLTDDGFKELSKLNNLKNLNICFCSKFTDEGLKELFKLKKLKDLNLEMCTTITDQGIKTVSTVQTLTTVALNSCKNITDEGVKDLCKLKNLKVLWLNYCNHITVVGFEDLLGLQSLTELCLSSTHVLPLRLQGEKWKSIRRINAERIALAQFIKSKSQKFGIMNCEPSFKNNEHEMSCIVANSEFQISINSLFLFGNKDIDLFLSQHGDHQESIQTFLIQKKPELLDRAASDLIEMFNQYNTPYGSMANSEDNRILAKEILIMHAQGKLEEIKHFLLTHEMSHARDHIGAASFGAFDPSELDFIKSHQYGEVRADLTAAREENAHELGIAFFELRSIIAGQSAESDHHPTDGNRAKAIKIDLDKRLLTPPTN